MNASAPGFTCPTCGAVSHNPNDALHSYCARCKAFQEPAPDVTAAALWRDFNAAVAVRWNLGDNGTEMARHLFYAGIGACMVIVNNASHRPDMLEVLDRLQAEIMAAMGATARDAQ